LLDLLIQFYLNDVTNLHQLTSHSTTCPATWRSYRDHRLLWHHFTVCKKTEAVRIYL